MAPPLTGKSLILHPRILPNGAGADTIGAVIAKCPSGALHPGSRATNERGDYDDQMRTFLDSVPLAKEKMLAA